MEGHSNDKLFKTSFLCFFIFTDIANQISMGLRKGRGKVGDSVMERMEGGEREPMFILVDRLTS